MSSGTVPDEAKHQDTPLDDNPIETAPSIERDAEPTLARWVGAIGWTMAATGGMVVGLNLFLGPRLVPSWVGYAFLFIGILGMLFHAGRDGDPQIRRYYGYVGIAWLVIAALFTLVPGAPTGVATKSMGFFFTPYAVGCLFIALGFFSAFATRETDERFRDMVLLAVFAVGGVLSAAAFIGGVANPDFLIGPGVICGLLGLIYFGTFVTQKGSAGEVGHQVGLLIGLIGLIFFIYGLGRSIVPALATPDRARSLFLIGGIAAVLGVGVRLLTRTNPTAEGKLIRGIGLGVALLGVVTLILAGLGVAKVFVGQSLPPYFVPYGLMMMGLGAMFVTVSIGVCSDAQFVVLTRKELTGYFYSPIAYLVLFGFMVAGWFNYFMFVEILILTTVSPEGPGAMMEPILSRYIYSLYPVMAVAFVVPAITMRLFSEENRTATMEVLFTAPVREVTVVLSKFFASLIFFLFLWIPWAMFLVVLRIEGGTPFDYKPLLGFFVALVACGSAFLSMGLFFSSLTKNQIVAAVLTFSGMMTYILFHLIDRFPMVSGTAIGAFFQHMSFLDLWQDALAGKLAVSDLFLQMSLAVFWLYLTVKVLESRRWK